MYVFGLSIQTKLTRKTYKLHTKALNPGLSWCKVSVLPSCATVQPTQKPHLILTKPSLTHCTKCLPHLSCLPSEGYCMDDHNYCHVPLQLPWTISPLISWGTHPPPTKNIMLSFLYTDLWGQAKTPESLPMITNLLMLKDGLIKRFTYKTKLMC